MKRHRIFAIGLSVVCSVTVAASLVSAATTISTNIQTDGNLSVTGTASTTLFSASGPAYFGATATSTFSTAGWLGIDTSSPQYQLDMESSGSDFLNLEGNSSYADLQAVSYRNSSITHALFDGYGYRGTQASPLAISADDAVTSIRAESYTGVPDAGGNGDGTNEISTIDFKADDAVSNSTGLETQGGAIWFSTQNGSLLNQAQANNGFTFNGTQAFPDTRLYIGSDGNIGIGTGGIDCGVNTTCFLNADVSHDFPTQVYFGSNNGGAANKGGPADLSYSTKVVIVPGTNQGTIAPLTVGGSTATTTFAASGSVGVGSSSPIANFQVANGNATTTMEVGSTGQSKGSCVKLYRTDGSAIYAYVAAGATTFTLTTTACGTVSNF